MSVLCGLQVGPEVWDSSLHVQHEDQLDRCLLEPEVLELERLQAVPADQHGQGTPVPLSPPLPCCRLGLQGVLLMDAIQDGFPGHVC